MKCEIIKGDCEEYLKLKLNEKFDLTFLDPPFNQNNTYTENLDEIWQYKEKKMKISAYL